MEKPVITLETISGVWVVEDLPLDIALIKVKKLLEQENLDAVLEDKQLFVFISVERR